jgi:hypothetical protein
MISNEIKKAPEADATYNSEGHLLAQVVWWVKEIAYQLAVMNERNAAQDQREIERVQKQEKIQEDFANRSDRR